MNCITQNSRIKSHEIVACLTLAEKALLHEGNGSWFTNSVERLSLFPVRMSDGPHGLRKNADTTKPTSPGNTVKAICFPAGCASSCSFDDELIHEMGDALGEECLAENVNILLGPAINIKRSPLCGRNFEYVSEDPLVAGKFAAAFINGVQKHNVGTSLKHFLANNQETARLISNSIIDERALREIYMRAFEIAIKESHPWTIMCSYNRINGEYATSNKRIMTDILRNEWGFEGLVMTDWGALDDRVSSVKAGVDLEMPQPPAGFANEIIEAINHGDLELADLNANIERLCAIAIQIQSNSLVSHSYDEDKHHALARKIARESAVLLENDGTLPVNKDAKIALIGEFAKYPRYQGSGSSKIVPTVINSAYDEFRRHGINFTYSDGYDGDKYDKQRQVQAVATANEADVIFVFVGLPDSYESEGYDRKHMKLPLAHDRLVKALIKTHKPIVAILSCGSAVQIPWKNDVNSLLLMNLAGQNSGGATYDLLFGDYSPCGKLSETYPLSIKTTPAIDTFGSMHDVFYRESIFVGYRYYDTAKIPVAYTFGYGLSYSKFEYNNIRVSKNHIADNETLDVTLTVTNIGSYTAKEIVQLYVAPPKVSTIFRPAHELRAYKKVELAIGRSADVVFSLDKDAFAYYNVNINDWHVETGAYTIEIASSSRDVRLTTKVHVSSTINANIPDYRICAPMYYYSLGNDDSTKFGQLNSNISQKQFEALYTASGNCMPYSAPLRPFTINSTLRDLKQSRSGQKIYNAVLNILLKDLECDVSNDTRLMLESMLLDTPLRSSIFMPNALSPDALDGIVEYANGNTKFGNEILHSWFKATQK